MTTLVIGDGAAGATAAHICLDATVVGDGGGGTGRLATRAREATTYDVGTTCVPDRGDERSTLVREVLAEDCVSFEGRVDPLGEATDGGVSYRRLTGRCGLQGVVDRLLAAEHCDHRPDTTVERLERTDDGWRAHTTEGVIDAERVVTATDADRTASLLAESEPLGTDVRREAEQVEHRTVDSVVLGYEHAVDRDWYALAAPGDDHDVRWLSRESAKPGHVPPGHEALVLRLGDDWATSHDPDAAVEQARTAAARLLDDDRLLDPAWTDHERYQYARPGHRVDPVLVERAAASDCYLAGDWVAGTTRTFAPLETGLDAGRRAMGFAQQVALQ